MQSGSGCCEQSAAAGGSQTFGRSGASAGLCAFGGWLGALEVGAGRGHGAHWGDIFRKILSYAREPLRHSDEGGRRGHPPADGALGPGASRGRVLGMGVGQQFAIDALHELVSAMLAGRCIDRLISALYVSVPKDAVDEAGAHGADETRPLALKTWL